MSRFVKGLVVIILLGVIILIILYPKIGWPWDEATEAEGTAPAVMTAPVLQVDGVVATPKKLVSKLSVTGEVVPNEFVELRSEISGILSEINFREGAAVRKGQVLARINVDDLHAERAKLVHEQRLRETLENRQRQLLEREAISQEEYDEALNELNTATADIAVIDVEIARSVITAPFAGVIGLREVSEGAYITPTDVIAPLYSIHPAKIQFAVPGKYSSKVKVGDRVAFTTEGAVDTFIGDVYAVEPRVDPNTRTLAMRARCPNPQGVLLPGQFARVDIVLQQKDSVIMVPTQAVVPELGGNKVFLSQGDRVAAVNVETGVRTDTELEILSGIAPGDTVITTGILQVRPGTEVKVNL
jgi:membrane fusion protein (multidrug efflux system)